jgi:hypothetical protein
MFPGRDGTVCPCWHSDRLVADKQPEVRQEDDSDGYAADFWKLRWHHGAIREYIFQHWEFLDALY